MSDTFSLMYFGNSLCAIFAGMVAEAAANAMPLTPFSGIWHYGGYCAPFDLSATLLVICFCLITVLWTENYGNASKAEDTGCSDVSTPLQQMGANPSILLAGAVISLFEGSMYIFVFNWTPALSAHSNGPPPFGLIFATFMVACMGGSSLFAIAVKKTSAAQMLKYVFFIASIALASPVFIPGVESTLCAFLLFEACVGIYWPAMGTVRSQVVPEATRATIYNIFRVPLNAIVLSVLLNNMKPQVAFGWCGGMLFVACLCQRALAKRMETGNTAVSTDTDDDKLPSDNLLSGSDKEY
jgi:hypothetical protein